jgi:hypothetical protein
MLKMYLLTPDGCMQPQKRSFVVSKTSYNYLDTDLPESRMQSRASLIQRSAASLGKEPEILTDYQYYERRRERNKLTGRKRELFPENCPTCGGKHIEVQYFGFRHICETCKEYLKAPDGRFVKVLVDDRGQIQAIAKDDKKLTPPVDPSDLRIFERKCYASFAGEDELVVLMFEGGWTY